MASDDDVQLPDLQVIQSYSLAVRGATAPRADVVAALQADLDWLTGGARRRSVTPPRTAAAPAKAATAPAKAAKAPAKPAKVPAKAAKARGKTPAKKASATRAPAKKSGARRA